MVRPGKPRRSDRVIDDDAVIAQAIFRIDEARPTSGSPALCPRSDRSAAGPAASSQRLLRDRDPTRPCRCWVSPRPGRLGPPYRRSNPKPPVPAKKKNKKFGPLKKKKPPPPKKNRGLDPRKPTGVGDTLHALAAGLAATWSSFRPSRPFRFVATEALMKRSSHSASRSCARPAFTAARHSPEFMMRRFDPADARTVASTKARLDAMSPRASGAADRCAPRVECRPVARETSSLLESDGSARRTASAPATTRSRGCPVSRDPLLQGAVNTGD